MAVDVIHLIKLVRAGDELLITDRGRAIARLVPVGGERVIDQLIREGAVVPTRQGRRRRPTPIRAERTVSDLIADQRR